MPKVISNLMTAGHHRPASEAAFEWRFAGGTMVAQDGMLASIITQMK